MPDAAALLAGSRDRVLREYGPAIGRRREELVTPALVLDIGAAQRNIDRMASELRRIGPTTIRPHYKTHKSPDLARRQVQAGASGLSMATVWEAAVLAAAGFDDLFVVNTVAHPDKIRLLAELARDHRILVAVDEAANAAAHSAAAVRAGSTVGIFVEVDTGMNRCGVDTAAEALALARQVRELPGLRFEGITGYEGHCTLTPEEDLRHDKQQQAMKLFTGVADLLEANGVACPVRSAGGIATWHWTAAYPGITEIQAGSYVVMDNFHGNMVPGFEHSLTIQASVISRQSKQVIVDVGSKSVADPADVTIVGHDLQVLRFDEEHGIFAAPDGSPLRAGDCVTLVPGYSPSTVNCYDAFHVVQDDVVVDIWPIIPRGPGHHGLAPSAARVQAAASLRANAGVLWTVYRRTHHCSFGNMNFMFRVRVRLTRPMGCVRRARRQEPADRAPLTEVGQIFRMDMYHPGHPDGHYQMANKVQVLDPPRAIGWLPGTEKGDGQWSSAAGTGGTTWRRSVRPRLRSRSPATGRQCRSSRRSAPSISSTHCTTWPNWPRRSPRPRRRGEGSKPSCCGRAEPARKASPVLPAGPLRARRRRGSAWCRRPGA